MIRDYAESLVVAVIIALLLKHFLVEAYRIPTGSMQPTLIGSPETGLHDRILVDKLSYRFRDPERWEVVVFRYPLDLSKNFVKRVVGMPGEELRIDHGDLWTREDGSEPWRILRRPRSVQRATWKRLDRVRPEVSSWNPVSGADGWRLEGRDVGARGDGKVRFGESTGPIVDRYWHGYPDGLVETMRRIGRPAQTHHVGDLRVAGTARALPGLERVEVQLYEGRRRYVFELPGPAAEEGAGPRIRVLRDAPGEPSSELDAAEAVPFRLPAGAAVAFDVQNLDDLLELSLDGEVVATLEIEGAFTELDRASAAHVAVHGEGVDLTDLMVWRDIFYVPRKTNEVQVPDGAYFVLGDNTQDSSDGREWTRVDYRLRGADGEELLVRGNYRKGSYVEGANPYVEPGGEEGTRIWLQDVWGERRRFLERDVLGWDTTEVPLVERRFVLGRALAVFWPIAPRYGLVRLGWVR